VFKEDPTQNYYPARAIHHYPCHIVFCNISANLKITIKIWS